MVDASSPLAASSLYARRTPYLASQTVRPTTWEAAAGSFDASEDDTRDDEEDDDNDDDEEEEGLSP